jgi:hypothetical protein
VLANDFYRKETQMIDILLYVISAAVAAGLAFSLWGRGDDDDSVASKAVRVTRRYAVATAIAAVFDVLGHKKWLGVTGVLGDGFVYLLLYGAAVSVWGWLAAKLGISSGDGVDDRNVRRGSSIADAGAVARALRREQSRFDVGGVPVPVELETRSFLLAGSPGTGKSQALTRALDALERDGARAILADPSGQFCERFYSPERGDVIINPHDARSVSWSPLAEIETVADIPAMSKSLIPDAEGEAKVWSNYAQQFVEAILEHCFTAGLTNAHIYALVTSASIEQLQQVCANAPAAALVQPGNERMFSSVRASAVDAVSALRWLDPAAGRDAFSIRRHVVEEKQGWIFLTYQQQHRAGLSRMIAACIDVASRAVLSLPPDLSRRVIFSLDEMPLLGKVQSLVELATNGRKHGAVIFAGLQTIAQLRDAYGRETAQTLLSCLGSWLVLRVSDAETADFMSRYLGDQEIERVIETKSRSSNWQQVANTHSTSQQQQIVTQRAILPSELQQLPDMVGYFNLAGPTPVARVKLDLAPARKQADAFLPAPPRARQNPQPVQQPQAQQNQPQPPQAAFDDLL